MYTISICKKEKISFSLICPVGYLMDKVYWCGQEDPPGINYNECIDITECEFVAEYSFWRMASQVVRQWYKCVPCTIRNNKILKKKR